MPIRQLFHMMHIVDDFDEAERRYQALLAPQVFHAKHWSDFDKRWASLAVVGPDFVLEIMEPSSAEADAGHALPKFHRRHGAHLHSMAWYVDPDDMVATMERLRAVGVRVLTPYPETAGKPPHTFFTHPKDTCGQLELQALPDPGAPGHALADPRFQAGWTRARWREHPLGLRRLSELTTVVADVARARAVYEQGLSARVLHEETTSERHSVHLLVGSETVVELAQPRAAGGAGLLAADLAAHGEILHAATFAVADLAAAEAHVRACGLGICERSDDTIVVDPGDLFGAVIAFSTRRIPGDPRA